MTNNKPKILVLFYSMYGHVFALANEIVKGVEEAGGIAVLKQVAELIPEANWDDNIRNAKELMKNIPVADPKTDLEGIDGIIVGTPTRFGNMSAQMRNFWDRTSSTWLAGGLVGKPASVFVSTATQHGGQETTIITTLVTLLHHGMVCVGLPYSYQEQMRIDEITGGSPYGASTIAGGMGERMPSVNELKLARDLGRHHTGIAGKLMGKV
ncbi:MAG: NAD(P)H:quinone oxidoreductase [Candidatus Methanoperedens sp.]|jgi:NAD(P)H dehydrogenase (quinone)|nr:NAD(P)H:quinone oxidoreductase [Candidatus Methanoperedens sp.]PKL54528.1 MAG: NAD(P)H:quinone oxidoreductase [Candidatus Methanoperedenaceae archaeon HGW-Methanoperedenaceae-1]